jgi:hypothetical protein
VTVLVFMALAAPVHFDVEVPHCTPLERPVMLRSNRLDPAVFVHDEMTAIDDTHFTTTVEVATDAAAFEYKYSLGVCDASACPGIEKQLTFDGSAGDIAPRKLIESATAVADAVFIWRDAVRRFDVDGQPLEVRATGEKVAFCAPYLSIGDDGRVIVSHDTYDAAPLQIELGLTPTYGTTLTTTGSHRNHVVLPPLSPGATYHYRVSQGGRVSADLTFRAPPVPAESFRLGFVGDVQYYGEEDRFEQRQVIAQLLAFAPDLVLAAGDLVASEQDTGGQFVTPEMGRFNVLFSVLAPLMARAPFLTAMGNHEEDAPYYWDVFAFPTPDAPKLDHYALRYGSAHITVLYTGVTEGYDFEGILDSQTPWLQATLAAAAADPLVRWKIVVLHRGPFSQGARHPTDGQAFFETGSASRPSWAELFSTHGVDLVLAGHNHNFTVAEHQGIHFVTSCAGAPVHELQSPWSATTIYAEETCTADRFVVTPKTLSFSAVRPDGTEVVEAAFSLCREDGDCAELEHSCAAAASWACVARQCVLTCLEPEPDPELQVPDVPADSGCSCSTISGLPLVILLRRRRARSASSSR